MAGPREIEVTGSHCGLAEPARVSGRSPIGSRRRRRLAARRAAAGALLPRATRADSGRVRWLGRRGGLFTGVAAAPVGELKLAGPRRPGAERAAAPAGRTPPWAGGRQLRTRAQRRLALRAEAGARPSGRSPERGRRCAAASRARRRCALPAAGGRHAAGARGRSSTRGRRGAGGAADSRRRGGRRQRALYQLADPTELALDRTETRPTPPAALRAAYRACGSGGTAGPPGRRRRRVRRRRVGADAERCRAPPGSTRPGDRRARPRCAPLGARRRARP
jgi:hypothetical protein